MLSPICFGVFLAAAAGGFPSSGSNMEGMIFPLGAAIAADMIVGYEKGMRGREGERKE